MAPEIINDKQFIEYTKEGYATIFLKKRPKQFVMDLEKTKEKIND